MDAGRVHGGGLHVRRRARVRVRVSDGSARGRRRAATAVGHATQQMMHGVFEFVRALKTRSRLFLQAVEISSHEVPFRLTW